jgi:1,4-dihydroxy-2-naphthoate octaprenyltransferase
LSEPLPTGALGRLRFALKPASWPKLLVPAAIGVGLAVDTTGALSVPGALAMLAITVLDLVFVVCLNDWGDREVDALKRRMFPATSPKTIPDGVLSAHALLGIGLAAGLAALALSVAVSLLLSRPLLPALVLGALMTFWLYSLPPIRLNYRGGGELLEALGVGVILPALGSYLGAGRLFGPSATMLAGWTMLALASAVASGLADERSDRAGGKRTVVTMLGNSRARRLVVALSVVGPLSWFAATFFVEGGPPRPLAIAAALTALDGVPTLHRRSEAAVTDAFGAIHDFKSALHGLGWRAGLVWAVGLAVAPAFGW